MNCHDKNKTLIKECKSIRSASRFINVDPNTIRAYLDKEKILKNSKSSV